jgi:hypothetical protein
MLIKATLHQIAFKKALKSDAASDKVSFFANACPLLLPLTLLRFRFPNR